MGDTHTVGATGLEDVRERLLEGGGRQSALLWSSYVDAERSRESGEREQKHGGEYRTSSQRT